jgi:hypothetical protein
MKYIYHYYSIHKTELRSLIYSDGTYAIEKPITSHDDYLKFKEEVAKECGVTKEQLTICSFSLIYGETLGTDTFYAKKTQ